MGGDAPERGVAARRSPCTTSAVGFDELGATILVSADPDYVPSIYRSVGFVDGRPLRRARARLTVAPEHEQLVRRGRPSLCLSILAAPSVAGNGIRGRRLPPVGRMCQIIHMMKMRQASPVPSPPPSPSPSPSPSPPVSHRRAHRRDHRDAYLDAVLAGIERCGAAARLDSTPCPLDAPSVRAARGRGARGRAGQRRVAAFDSRLRSPARARDECVLRAAERGGTDATTKDRRPRAGRPERGCVERPERRDRRRALLGTASIPARTASRYASPVGRRWLGDGSRGRRWLGDGWRWVGPPGSLASFSIMYDSGTYDDSGKRANSNPVAQQPKGPRVWPGTATGGRDVPAARALGATVRRRALRLKLGLPVDEPTDR